MRCVPVWVLLVVACQTGSRDRPAVGTERGDCRGDRTCEVGLLCLSDLCVRPPPADCAPVAETLASLELGNYAAVEERAPVVAGYQAACEVTRVSKEEAACLDKVRDRWSAAQCVPRMFPDMKSNPEACAKVATKIRELMAAQAAAFDQNPQQKHYFETSVRVMRESCEQDRWPRPYIECALANTQQGDMTMYACNQQLPPALQQKLQDRLQTAMREQMR